MHRVEHPMYGLRMVKGVMNKTNAFHNGCLWKIDPIIWPEKIANKELHRKTKSHSVVLEIKCHWLRWLGHALKLDQNLR